MGPFLHSDLYPPLKSDVDGSGSDVALGLITPVTHWCKSGVNPLEAVELQRCN